MLKILFKYLLKWELSDLTSLRSFIEELNLLLVLSYVDIDESLLEHHFIVWFARIVPIFFFFAYVTVQRGLGLIL